MPGDTIAAVATGPGAAALGIVRVSGPLAARIVDAVVPSARAAARPRRVCPGRAVDPATGREIDEVLCFFAPGPGTATGEDVAEIHGHGGPVVMGALLRAALAAGARPASPGEFTCRAFRLGRLDLTQAEAVMGLVAARSERAARAALRQLGGGVGARLGAAYDALTGLAAEVEAGLDFPDEDLPPGDAARLGERLRAIAGELAALAGTFPGGRRLAGGAAVAIVGPPNAGKSSLLNRLAGSERALVDSEPGTTRDVVEAEAELSGVRVRLLDTAGLRAAAGRVEALGIAKGEEAAGGADVVVVVLDGAVAQADPGAIGSLLAGRGPGPAAVVVAVNKSDLPGWRGDRVPASLAGARRVAVSALTGDGCPELGRAIGGLLAADEEPAEVLLTTERQHAAVASARDGVEKAASLLGGGAYPELAAAELRFAREALASLFGRAAGEDVLDAVFSKFCLGK